MSPDLIVQLPLALFWVAYAALHSLLAANRVKILIAAAIPSLHPYYRSLYNLLAVLLLIPAGWLAYRTPGPPLWAWHGLTAWGANGLCAVLAVLLLRPVGYDTQAFVGLAPERTGLVIGPWHRYVRHPWYFVGLVLIWTRDMNLSTLVSALAITAYFVIGSRLEEAKLIAVIGDPYRDYQRRVAALLPLPWKILDPQTARQLMVSAKGSAIAPGADSRGSD